VLSSINFRPDDRLLRQFGCLCCVLLTGLSASRLLRLGIDVVVAGQLLLTAVSLLVAMFRPGWLRLVFVGWTVATFPLGWFVSHLLLFVMYFGVFWPTAVVLRLFRWDPLGLRPSGTGSFWNDRPLVSDLHRYFRQY
jgi:hypothetical protein